MPARVYWVRRSLLLVTVFVLVFGIGRLFGGGDDDKAPVAQTAASSSNPTPTQAAKPFIGPQAFTPATPGKKPGARPGKQPATTPTFQPTTPLPMPTTDCDPQEITVTPVLAAARAGQDVQIPLDVTGTATGCRFKVGGDSLALKITLDGKRIWSSQQCPDAIKEQTIAVRSAGATRINLTWSGRYSDEACSASTDWAMPDTYQAEAAVIGSEPSEAAFRLTWPPRPVVTQTATPHPEVKGKQTKCGGDIASGSC